MLAPSLATHTQEGNHPEEKRWRWQKKKWEEGRWRLKNKRWEKKSWRWEKWKKKEIGRSYGGNTARSNARQKRRYR